MDFNLLITLIVLKKFPLFGSFLLFRPPLRARRAIFLPQIALQALPFLQHHLAEHKGGKQQLQKLGPDDCDEDGAVVNFGQRTRDHQNRAGWRGGGRGGG